MKEEIAGVLLVDKPPGPTSHDVVNRVRRVTGIRRVGHTGTLDPLATGLLILCLGRATRLAEYVIGQRKSYQATVHLGFETTTYDSEGEILAHKPDGMESRASDVEAITLADVEESLSQFRGVIKQRPPAYSAIKLKGQPLYRLARQGQEVVSPEREVTVYELELVSWSPPELTMRLVCSSGTYVRSIAHDLGRSLGCGGFLAALRRFSIGPLSLDEAVPLNDLAPETWRDHLRPMDLAIEHLRRINLSLENARHLAMGQKVPKSPDEGRPAELVRAYDPLGTFVGLLVVEEAYWRPRKIFYSP